MKKTVVKVGLIGLMAVAVCVLAMFWIQQAGKEEEGILGAWEAEVEVVGLTEERPTTENRSVLRFMEDSTCTLQLRMDGEVQNEQQYTYQCTEEEVQFASDPDWTFSYVIEGDDLTFTHTQSQRTMTFHRMK